MSARKMVLVAFALVSVLLLVLHVRGGGGGEGGGCGVVRAYLCVAARAAWSDIIEAFERRSCVRVEPVYDASGRLLARIVMLRDADVYAPASMDYIVEASRLGLVWANSTVAVAYLVPAILVPRGNPAGVRGLGDLARPGVRVALGDPDSVAVGRYAVRLLERYGLWGRVERNVVVYAENFAHLVGLVASGAVDAAIGWSVASRWFPGRVEAIPIPLGEGVEPSPIPLALATTSRHPGAALEFIRFACCSREAVEVWRRYGYLPAVELNATLRVS